MLAPLIATTMAATPLNVGVLYFDNLTGDAKYDVMQKGLADMIITDLAAVPGIVVVERQRLQDVISEQSLQKSRFFDPATAVKAGKLVGASHVLTGTLSAVEPRLRLDVRMIDVKKATVLATSAVSGPREDLFELEQQLMQRFVAALAIKQAIPKPQSSGTSADALLQFSKGLDQADQGDIAGAQSTMAAVMQAAPGFSLAKTRYAELLQRVAAATERRTVVLGAEEAALEEEVARSLAAPIPADRKGREYAFGMRVAGLTLALKRLEVAIAGKAERRGPIAIVLPASRAEVERLEAAAVRAIDLMRRDLMSLGGAAPYSTGFDIPNEQERALETLVGRGSFIFLLSVTEPELRVMRARLLLGGELGHFYFRPTPVQRAPKLLESALEQAREAGGDNDFETFRMHEVAGLALVRAGRKEDAIAIWQRFLDAHPKSDKFGDVKKRIEDTLMVTADVAAGVKKLETCAADAMMSWQRLFTVVALVERGPGIDRLLKQIEKCAPKQGGLAMGWRTNGYVFAIDAAAEVGDCELLTRYRKKGLALSPDMALAFSYRASCE